MNELKQFEENYQIAYMVWEEGTNCIVDGTCTYIHTSVLYSERSHN